MRAAGSAMSDKTGHGRRKDSELSTELVHVRPALPTAIP